MSLSSSIGADCATASVPLDVSALVAPSWAPAFPSPDLVQAAASLLTPLPPSALMIREGRRTHGTGEGPRARLVLSPGSVQIAVHDPARAERTVERARSGASKDADLRAAELLLERHLRDADADLGALAALADGGLVSWRHVEAAGRVADLVQARLHRREDPASSAVADLLGVDESERLSGPARVVTAWSAKSRANMVKRLATLDYGPLFASGNPPAMVTLTYPGEWEAVAPDAKTCAGHLRAFAKRFHRAWGVPLVAVWKREFQRRGAPHYHLNMVPPRGRAQIGRDEARRVDFRTWLSLTWADVVGAPSCGEPVPTYADVEGRSRIVCCERHRHEAGGTGIDFAEGMRASDPRRLAIYFAKHGAYSAKEYQNEAPALWRESGAGVGRFWGYWGLQPATVTVEVSDVERLAAARTLRRWQRANGYRVQREVVRRRWDTATGELRGVRVRKSGAWSGARMRGSAGFVTINDAPALVSTLVRYLDQVRESAQDDELAAWAASPSRLAREWERATRREGGPPVGA